MQMQADSICPLWCTQTAAPHLVYEAARCTPSTPLASQDEELRIEGNRCTLTAAVALKAAFSLEGGDVCTPGLRQLCSGLSNRVVRSIGGKVRAEYTADSAVLDAAWCRFAASRRAALCLLQAAALTVVDADGDVQHVPLQGSFTRVLPLPGAVLVTVRPCLKKLLMAVARRLKNAPLTLARV